MNPETRGLHTHYTLLCDDIRFEIGNRLSLMGMFHSIATAQLPLALIKLAVITYWHGQGAGSSEVRVVSPDRSEVIVVSDATPLSLMMLCVPTLMPTLVSEKFTASEALARTQLYSLEPWVKLMSAPS